MALLRMLMGSLTVFLSCNSMLLCLLVFSLFVVMNSFAVVMCRRFMVPCCFVVVLAGGVFHGHEVHPFKKTW